MIHPVIRMNLNHYLNKKSFVRLGIGFFEQKKAVA